MIVIIGILAAISMPSFIRARENVLDKEASASLKLIQTTQKIFGMENGNYYPSSGSTDDMGDINDNLRINLDAGSGRKWNYSCSSNGCAQAERYNGPDDRTWRLRIDESNPVASTCP